jgi:pSer/pThr/pTyr-binding forkhead associated (FHA) protein
MIRYSGPDFGEEIPLDLPATIGRHPKASLVLRDSGSSRYHTRIEEDGRGFRVIDLDSRNGTFLNGLRLEAISDAVVVIKVGGNRKDVSTAPLCHGDVVRIGDSLLLFVDDRGMEWEGRTLGDFEIRSRTDRFDLATEYEAHQISLDRDVVVTLLDEDLDPDDRDRIIHEARLSGKVQGAAAVKVFDIAETEGRVLIVTEPLQGDPLDIIASDPRGRPTRTLVQVGIRLCDAVAEAHLSGITLRGLDPRDIRLSPGGIIKIAHLGIGPGASRARFISPEEAAGEPPSPTSDVYTIAKCLMSLAGGAKAPAALRGILANGAAERIQDRLDTPKDLGQELREVLQDRPAIKDFVVAEPPKEEAPPEEEDTGGMAFARAVVFLIFCGSLFFLASQIARYLLR